MPHSTQASIDATQSNYSVARPLTAASVVLSHSPASANTVSSSGRHSKFLAQQTPHLRDSATARLLDSNRKDGTDTPAWKRASVVVADAYASLIGTGVHDMIYEMPERNSVNYGGDGESKRRIQYYDDAFEYKPNAPSSARERVHNESPVVAELRTNVIIKDEFTLVTDLSYHLAARYTRPDSSIMINIDHSACLALAGTFEPCYILTLTTLPSQMQPVTNKRNAALIQAFMADILSVPPDRGIVKFAPIPEENLAMNGNTMLGEIERLEKAQSGDTAIKRSISDARKSMPVFSKKSTSILETIPSSQPNGISPEQTTKQTRRRSNTASPTPGSPIPNVFELAGGGKEDERPSTSRSSSYAALNGLRLNGVSKEDLVGSGSRLPNGRPKTFSGTPAPLDSHTEEPLPNNRASGGGSRESTPKAERRRSAIPTSAKPVANPNPLSPIPQLDRSERPKSRSNGTSTPTLSSTRPAAERSSPSKSSSSNPTIAAAKTAATRAAAAPSPDVPLSSNHNYSNRGDPAANMAAKRKSGVTATPRMPEGRTNGLVPPPVPESRPAPKMSKRKSFLSAFRR